MYEKDHVVKRGVSLQIFALVFVVWTFSLWNFMNFMNSGQRDRETGSLEDNQVQFRTPPHDDKLQEISRKLDQVLIHIGAIDPQSKGGPTPPQRRGPSAPVAASRPHSPQSNPKLPNHPALKCTGEPLPAGDSTGIIHASIEKFDKAAALRSPNLAHVLWGPDTVIMTHGPGDMVSRSLLEGGLWESDNMEAMLALFWNFGELQEKIAFFDIGSNIGLFGLMAAAYGHQVYMFEPVPQNLNRICESIALNNFESVVVFPIGLHKQPGKLPVYIHEDNFGGSRFGADSADYFAQVDTLDRVFPYLGIPSSQKIILKVDVEQLEVEVFEGGSSVFYLPNVIAIYFENSMGYPPPPEQRLAWLQRIEAAGFEMLCCALCQSLRETGSRCRKVDVTRWDTVSKEMVAVRSEYVELISTFDCRGRDWESCFDGRPYR